MATTSGGGRQGCLSLRVPIGVTGIAVWGCWRWFLARHRASSSHVPDPLEPWALHLVLQKHVVLWRKPQTGPGGTGQGSGKDPMASALAASNS